MVTTENSQGGASPLEQKVGKQLCEMYRIVLLLLLDFCKSPVHLGLEI